MWKRLAFVWGFTDGTTHHGPPSRPPRRRPIHGAPCPRPRPPSSLTVQVPQHVPVERVHAVAVRGHVDGEAGEVHHVHVQRRLAQRRLDAVDPAGWRW